MHDARDIEEATAGVRTGRSGCRFVAVVDRPNEDIKLGITRVSPDHPLLREHPDWWVEVRSERGRDARARSILDRQLGPRSLKLPAPKASPSLKLPDRQEDRT